MRGDLVGQVEECVGYVLDVLVQSRLNTQAPARLMLKLLRKHGRTPRVMITDKFKSYAAAKRRMGLKFEHRQHKGLNNRAENSHQPTRGPREGNAPLQISLPTAAILVRA